MKYKIRKFLQFITRGRWIKIRKVISSKISDDLEYYLGTDIGNKLYLTGKFEANELTICSNYINENSNIVDIGANIGTHSIYFAKVAKSAKVLSIEPQVTMLSNITKKYNEAY